MQWTASNALGFLTLGPAVVLFARGSAKALWPTQRTERFEFVTMLLVLALVARLALPTAATEFSNPFVIALLYAPVPLIVWCAVRFGAAGASAGVLTAGIVFVAHEMSGPKSLHCRDARKQRARAPGASRFSVGPGSVAREPA